MGRSSWQGFLDLTGKVAIVTGGASGIGEAIGTALVRAGANVTIADMNVEAAKKVAQEVMANGGKARVSRADVRIPGDAVATCQEVVDELGRLDILVNNAGVFPAFPALEVTEEMWDSVFDINLKGSFFFSQAAAKQMIKVGNGGRIINIGSLQGFHPSAMQCHYCTSKAGVHMLTKTLALELAPHKITVNAIAPGVHQTPGLDRQLGGFYEPMGMTREQFLQAAVFPRLPAGRIGNADDLGSLALFIASSSASYMTGAVILVDGGYLLS